MELIERYVAEFGRHLPENKRTDLERELRSSLEDALEDRSQAAGRAPDEEMVVALLKEFGAPSKAAAAYAPPRYLVGPRLYPLFLTTFKIILVVCAVVATILFVLAASQPGIGLIGLGEAIWKYGVNFLDSALQSFGILALIFAVVERFLPEWEQKSEDWDPRKLKAPMQEQDRVKIVDLGFKIAFSLIAIIVFNLYGNAIGIYIFTEGQTQFLPALSSVFFSYLPWLTAIWVLNIIHSIWLMLQGRWQPATRLAAVLIGIFNIAILIAMLGGPSLVEVYPQTAAYMAARGLTADNIAAIEKSVILSVRIGLAIGLAGEVVEVIKTVSRFITQKTGDLLAN